MNFYFKLFKVKEGKEQVWRDWCHELNVTRRIEAIESVRNCNLIHEGCYMFKGKATFVVGFMEWEQERIPSKGSLTDEHYAKIKECLDPVDKGEELYLI